MIKFIKTTTKDHEYAFLEDLLHKSFPETERRADSAQRFNTDNNDLFTAYIIKDENKDSITNVGIITIWAFNDFHYIEHLATSPEVRNKGYGAQIMKAITELFDNLIVLEVEMPEDEMSRRRIGFYERCGFNLCEKEYMQPPYRKDGQPLPMYIMYYGSEKIDGIFDSIKSEIYNNVYGVTMI